MSIRRRLLSLLIIGSLLIMTLSGCNKQSATVGIKKPTASAEDGSWSDIYDTAVLENDNIRFEISAETAHFTVTDKKNGNIYTSVPTEETEYISDDQTARIESDLTIEYYGEQTDKMFMYSSECIENEGILIQSSDSAIRVTYTFGEAERFVPEVLDEESFESILSEIESDGLRRRLERYYVFTSVKDKKGDYATLKKEYPILEKQNLYVIDSMITDIERDDIALYISQTGFGTAEYEEMLKKLELDDIKVKKSVGFTIPVEYTLNEDGFNASILVDKIKENSEDYKLQKIDLLEYFSAFSAVDGSFFVPDGSGATIDFGTESELTVPFYGEDYSIRRESEESLSKNLSFPVYGITGNDKGIFAIVEQAAEVAQLHISPKNSASALNHAYLSFIYRSIDVTDYGSNMQIPIYNLFSKTTLEVSPKVKYCLLPAEKKDYIAMANTLSDYLTENGIFTSSCSIGQTVYLDYLCMITEEASMLGVPYTKKTVLSTLEGITNSVKKMQSSGISNISVRLFGYTSDGFEHSAYTDFELDRRVGTKKQLEELSELLESTGGKLYLDADMQFASKSGNGFKTSDDSARYLNKLVVCRGKYDTVSRKYTDELRKYFISPSKYLEFSGNYIKSLKDKLSGNVTGISYGTTGLYLGGDYSNKLDIDRSESVNYLTEALENAKKNGMNMVFDNGNMYVLKYADALLNVPGVASEYDSETNSVPFTQMVLGGKVSFVQSPWNLATNPYESHINSALTGAGAYACFITEPDSLIYNTPYETMWYSLCDNSRLDEFIEKTKTVFEIQNSLGDSKLLGFERNGDVCCAEYSNGKKVYANFSSSEKSFNGISIPGRGIITEGV